MGKGGGKSKSWKSPIQTAFQKQPKDEAGGVIGELPGIVSRKGDKYGFVDSEDLKTFGFDSVLVTWDEMKEFQEGDTVIFTAFITSAGKAQGKDLKPLEAALQEELPAPQEELGEISQDLFAGMTQELLGGMPQSNVGNVGSVGKGVKGGKGGKGGKKAMGAQGAQGDLGGQASQVPKDEAGGILGQFVGAITRRGNKYGFLESKQLTDQHGVDSVMILWDEMKDFQVGQKVQFTAFLTSQGKAQGKDLKPRGFKIVPEDEAGGTLGEFFGIITRKADKYGFIECDELRAMGYDSAMATWEELMKHKQGDTVKFTAYLTSNDKAKAKNLQSTLALG